MIFVLNFLNIEQIFVFEESGIERIVTAIKRNLVCEYEDIKLQ